MAKSGLFSTTSGFCADCGSILPLMKQKGNVKCYTCPSEYSADGKLLKTKVINQFLKCCLF